MLSLGRMLRCCSMLSIVVLALALPHRGSAGEPDGHASGVISVPAPSGPCRVRSASDSPRGLMRRLRESYECGDLANYARLFTLDFRFLSNDPSFLEAHPNGLDRDEEIEVARHMFDGFTRADGTHEPLAVRIELQMDPLTVLVDRDVEGPPERWQVVTSDAVRLVVDRGGGAEIVTIGDRHEFHVVRGEGASLGPDQRGDADHWYIWKWDEHVKLESTWGTIRALYR